MNPIYPHSLESFGRLMEYHALEQPVTKFIWLLIKTAMVSLSITAKLDTE